jgi:general secretion pathway protein L
MNIRGVIQRVTPTKGGRPSSIEQFLQWWIDELKGLMPERLRSAVHIGPERLVVAIDGQEVELSHTVGQTAVSLGRFNLDTPLGEAGHPPFAIESIPTDVQVVVRLPADQTLRKVLTLPAVAEENLRQVLAFEMDRQTPFNAEQVFYDFRIVERLSATRQLRVALTVVPRTVLDPILERVGRWGLRPAVVDVAGQQGESGQVRDKSPINLLPLDRRPRAGGMATRVNMVLAGLAGVLLLAAVAIPLVQQRALVTELQDLVKDAARDARAVQTLQDELDHLREQSRFLVDKKRSAPLVIGALNALTKVIPDDTWLNNLNVQGSKVQIHGQSPAASKLIEAIEASDSFENTSFVSPVTKDPRSGLERFRISTQIVTGPVL